MTKVSLARVETRERVVVSRRLRGGTVRAALSRAPGASYIVRVVTGKTRLARRLRVVAPISPPAVRNDVLAGELRLDVNSGRVGDRFFGTLVNTGTVKLVDGLKLDWEVLKPDGTWAYVMPTAPTTAEIYTVAPGEARRFGGVVQQNLQPGTHRVFLVPEGGGTFLAPPGDATSIKLTAPFTVLP